MLIEERDLGSHVRCGGRGRRLAGLRQNLAAVLNRRRRRLTYVHEADRRQLYRLSIARHGYTYLLTALPLPSVRTPFEDHGPNLKSVRAVGFIDYLSTIGCYCKSLRINWGCWLACASTVMPACSNTLDFVKFAVSAAKSAS